MSAASMRAVGPFATRCVAAFMLFVSSTADGAPLDLADWLTTVDGLPDQRTESLARDAYGYVWIGSRGGLVRHEGRTLTVLRHDPDDLASLPGNSILSLAATRQGGLWAAVSGHGLVHLNGLEVQRHLRHVQDGGELQGRFVWSMAEDCNGALWAVYARDGLVRIGPGSDLSHYSPGAGGLPESGFGLEIAVDAACRIWMLRADGLWRVLPDASVRFRRVLAADEAASSVFIGLHAESDRRLWVGANDGLLEIRVDESAGNAVRMMRKWPMKRTVTSILPDGDGRLWLGLREGLELFDPETGTEIFSGEAAPGERGRPDRLLVSALLQGSEGQLWIATQRGVAQLPAAWRAVELIQSGDPGMDLAGVTALALNPETGRLWLGDRNSRAQEFDPGASSPAFGVSREAPLYGAVRNLHAEHGKLWMLDGLNLVVRELETGAHQVLMRRERARSPGFTFMASAGAGELWVGGEGPELLRVDAEDGKILDRWATDARASRHLGGEGAIAMQRGPAGQWWLLQDRTVSQLDAQGRFIVRFDAGAEQLLAMHFDQDRLWLASDSVLRSFGVSADGSLEERLKLTAGDGLPAGQVRALLADDRQLWLMTSIGLFRFDAVRREFHSFRINDRLTESGFNEGAVIALKDGRFAAGTPDGLVVIDPAHIRPSSVAPPIYITRLRAGGRSHEISPEADEVLALPWTVKSVDLEFRALSYADPAQIRYRTRLEGWDSQWRSFSGSSSRWYGNLSSGSYRFRVQAASADGTWNREGDLLEFRIAAPPWLSPPAQALYIMLTGLALVGGTRAARARRARRESLRRAGVQQQLAEQQRALLNRLNRSLEPDRLAATLVAALGRLSGVKEAHFGFLAPSFPEALWSWPAGCKAQARTAFLAAVERGAPGRVIVFGEGVASAAVWLLDDTLPGKQADPARLELFSQAVSQVIENARLLQQVRGLAEEARQANEAKSRFLATMSHEIRTPLHGLLGLLELLQRREHDSEQSEMLQTMMQSGRQLQRILNDVLDLSRIEVGALSISKMPLELMSLLEGVIDLHASTAEAKGLALRLRASARLPVMVCADGDRVVQILGNLLNNAIKFTAQGSVEAEVRMHCNEQLILAVSDTGPGISPAEQQRLFEPFTQLDQAATRLYPGTGLGLAICRELASAMGGSIELDSNPGRGSRFTVRLPVEPVPPFRSRASMLLSGFCVGSLLHATEHRVLMRLCARWGIRVARLPSDRPVDPNGIDALLFSANAAEARYVLEAWQGGLPCWQLGTSAGLPDVPLLRAPLLEKRLIGTLLDAQFSRRQR